MTYASVSTTPGARYGHALSVSGTRVFLAGGIAYQSKQWVQLYDVWSYDLTDSPPTWWVLFLMRSLVYAMIELRSRLLTSFQDLVRPHMVGAPLGFDLQAVGSLKLVAGICRVL